MSRKILIIDHNDSFTFNLVQSFEAAKDVYVHVAPVEYLSKYFIKEYDGIVLSPGPGLPKDYPQISKFFDEYHCLKPMLGVCLGLQHMVEYFGGTLYNQKNVMHGKQVSIECLVNEILFDGLKKPINVGLYHSWAVKKECFPSCLEITSLSKDGVIMSLRHKTLPLTAIQFHPESYMTEQGNKMIFNWIKSIKK